MKITKNMKLLALLLAILCAMSLVLSSCGDSKKNKNKDKAVTLKYEEMEDGTYAVSGIKSSKGTKVDIPDEYKGGEVVSIAEYAFEDETSIKSVSFGGNLSVIDNYAFKGCSKLSTLEFAEDGTLAYIGVGAFHGCSNLERVELPESVIYIDSYAFYRCEDLEYVYIPANVSYISANAFNECNSLTAINFGGTMEAALRLVWVGNPNITSIICSDGTLSLSGGLPADPEETNDPTETGTETPDNGVEYSIYGTTAEVTGYYGEGGHVEILSYYKGYPVVSIANYVFEDRDDIISVYIPSTVVTIGEYAFNGCAYLEDIQISDSVSYIGSYAFYGCQSLTNIDLPSSLEQICNYSFNSCTGLETLTIPDRVKSIGECAFANCSSLRQVTMGDGVTTIGGSSFEYCYSLENVEFSSALESIGSYAFYFCTALENIDLPSGTKYILSNAFSGCSSLTELYIPASVVYIEYGAFGNCSSLDEVEYGDTISRAQSLFSYSNHFFHNECKIICSDGAYWLSTNEVIYGGGEYESGTGEYDTGYETESGGYETGSDISWEYSGVEYETCYDLGSGSYYAMVSGNGEGLGSNVAIYAFDGIYYVKTIGERAFYSCSSIKNVHLSDYVETIESLAFAYCIAMESIEMSPNITTILNSAFLLCEKLTYIKDLPRTLEYIGPAAFRGCESLTTITYNGTVDEWHSIEKDSSWDANGGGMFTVVCTDGELMYGGYSVD